jgi:nicotinate-nucleotide adenylyltransferase
VTPRADRGREVDLPVLRPPRAPVAGSVGMLGGTFDPPHVGHLAIAEEAREALGLERVLFVPAALPPHKLDRAITPAADRAAMVGLAIDGNPAFALSDLELRRSGPSYTVDTVEELLAGGVRELTVILSAELLGDLPTWHEPERLLRLACLAVVPRPGYANPGPRFVAERFAGREDHVTFLAAPNLAISATDIRRRVAARRSVRYLVPDAVAGYIGDHGLYRNALEEDLRP